jgi:predicted GIY-YIG superfamily endonuclease
MVRSDHWSQQPGRVAVYRYYDKDGALLYVGSARDPQKRYNQHRSTAWRWWWDIAKTRVTWHQTREDAENEERRVYAEESPIHNMRIPTRWQKPA